MVYIGDSDTDIPCMKLVTLYGGHSIGVYNAETNDKSKVYKMMRDGRIKYYVPANYSSGTELDRLVKSIINCTAANEILEDFYYQCKKENIEADKQKSIEGREKNDLLIALENSRSFATTHSIIKGLNSYENWTSDEKELLFRIAIENSQVFYVLGDLDVACFYQKLLLNMRKITENANKVKDEIEKQK
jgi:hypothetical protein